MQNSQETNYERRVREEYACYNEELDLWNASKLEGLNTEEEMRRLMERIDVQDKSH
jgi:hypothetical protein